MLLNYPHVFKHLQNIQRKYPKVIISFRNSRQMSHNIVSVLIVCLNKQFVIWLLQIIYLDIFIDGYSVHMVQHTPSVSMASKEATLSCLPALEKYN